MGKSAADDTSTDTDKTKSTGKAPSSEAPKGEGDDSSLDHGKGPLEMSLKGYLRSCGQRPDQTAAFASYAARELTGRRTQQDWEQAFSKFCAKPLR